MDDHLKNMKSCKWCQIGKQFDGSTAYICVSPGALYMMKNDPELVAAGCVEAWCLNPDIIPCPEFETISAPKDTSDYN